MGLASWVPWFSRTNGTDIVLAVHIYHNAVYCTGGWMYVEVSGLSTRQHGRWLRRQGTFSRCLGVLPETWGKLSEETSAKGKMETCQKRETGVGTRGPCTFWGCGTMAHKYACPCIL